MSSSPARNIILRAPTSSLRSDSDLLMIASWRSASVALQIGSSRDKNLLPMNALRPRSSGRLIVFVRIFDASPFSSASLTSPLTFPHLLHLLSSDSRCMHLVLSDPDLEVSGSSSVYMLFQKNNKGREEQKEARRDVRKMANKEREREQLERKDVRNRVCILPLLSR